MGEKIYFTGPSHTFSDGDRLVHGGQGEVTGLATTVESHKGKGVCVLFPGNKGGIDCYLSSVRPLLVYTFPSSTHASCVQMCVVPLVVAFCTRHTAEALGTLAAPADVHRVCCGD